MLFSATYNLYSNKKIEGSPLLESPSCLLVATADLQQFIETEQDFKLDTHL